MNNSELELSLYLDSSLRHTEDTLNSRKEFRSEFVKACSSSRRDQTQPSITEVSIPVKNHQGRDCRGISVNTDCPLMSPDVLSVLHWSPCLVLITCSFHLPRWTLVCAAHLLSSVSGMRRGILFDE